MPTFWAILSAASFISPTFCNCILREKDYNSRKLKGKIRQTFENLISNAKDVEPDKQVQIGEGPRNKQVDRAQILDQEDLVSYIALEGKGTFNLEGEDPYETRESIFIEKNAVHSLRADENAAFILSLCEGE